MNKNDSRKKELDDFWNISELVPRKHTHIGHPKSIETVEITDAPRKQEAASSSDSTVIKRYIPPHVGSSELTKSEQFDFVSGYSQTDSLIHNVKIYKYKTSYNYYGTFLKNAIEYMDADGSPCDYVPFFSYVPQYDQMNDAQLSYYFWFRHNARKGVSIKTDYGYLFLYIFELLNLGTRIDVKTTQYILMYLWNEYNGIFPAISVRLADWICDYSLLHRLPPPINISSDIIKKVISLKEYYISIPKDDPERCAKTLMRYCSSYDYRASKFYTEQNKELFDKYIRGALAVAVRFYSSDGNILSGLDLDDSTVTRDVYAGAVCVADEKYRIKVSYCSFSRSNELRFLVGDIIRYSENKLRAHIGIKSKMTVYSITVELRHILDEYFSASLPPKRATKKAAERQEYDILYDIPKKPLSLSDAAKIEARSWETTQELISAFETDTPSDSEEAVSIISPAVEPIASENNSSEKTSADGKNDLFERYRTVITALLSGDCMAVSNYAKSIGKLPDAVADEINEIAYDTFGDQLIEDDGMGGYNVIEDYADDFR